MSGIISSWTKDQTGNCVALNSEFVTVVDAAGDRNSGGESLASIVNPNRVDFSYLSKDQSSEQAGNECLESRFWIQSSK